MSFPVFFIIYFRNNSWWLPFTQAVVKNEKFSSSVIIFSTLTKKVFSVLKLFDKYFAILDNIFQGKCYNYFLIATHKTFQVCSKYTKFKISKGGNNLSLHMPLPRSTVTLCIIIYYFMDICNSGFFRVFSYILR